MAVRLSAPRAWIKICSNLERQEDIFCSSRSTRYDAGKNGIDGDDENLKKLHQFSQISFTLALKGGT
jgi:hypothetical protein